MKKINLIIIIIWSTSVSIFNMVYYNNYANNLKYYEVGKPDIKAVVGYNKASIPKVNITIENQSKDVKKIGEEIYNSKDDLVKKKLNNDKESKDLKSSDIANTNLVNGDKEYNNDNTIEQEQSVFKVSSGRIQENLTTSDKLKLLYVSFQLGKENYKKVKGYLYAQDAEGGVLKALKLLKVELSKNEYGKVRKIAGKFIDMDAAEKLK